MKRIIGYLIILPLLMILMLWLPREVVSPGGQRVKDVEVIQSETVQKKRSEKEPRWRRRVVHERPDPDEVATEVSAALHVIDIFSVEDSSQELKARFRLFLHWKDSRLEGVRTRVLPLLSVWNPSMILVNGTSVSRLFQEKVVVEPTGDVYYYQDFIGNFVVPMNLTTFPFDKHRVSLILRSFYEPHEVEIILDEKLANWSKRLSIPDWIVSDGKVEVNQAYSSFRRADLAQIEFSFTIERQIGYYFWKIILPLSLIVFLSWGVFWIDPMRVEAQMGLAATSFLTLFAFQFAISSFLPRISYLTRLDWFLLVCNVLVFLAVLESVVTNYLTKSGDIHNARKIDRLSRVTFPALFLLAIVLLFFKVTV